MDPNEILRWLRDHVDLRTIVWIVIVFGGVVGPIVRGVREANKRRREMEERRARGEVGAPPPPVALDRGEEEAAREPVAQEPEPFEEIPQEPQPPPRRPEPVAAAPEPAPLRRTLPPPPPAPAAGERGRPLGTLSGGALREPRAIPGAELSGLEVDRAGAPQGLGDSSFGSLAVLDRGLAESQALEEAQDPIAAEDADAHVAPSAPSDWRRAIVAAEILDRPLSLRQ